MKKIAEETIDQLISRADSYVSQNRWLHAIQIFDQILDIDETYLPAYYAVAEHYIGQRHLDSAENYLLDAHDVDPKDERTLFLLGNVSVIRNEPKKALEWYQKIDIKNNSSAELTYNMGLANMRLSQLQEAVDYFLKAIEHDPFFPRIHEILAEAYIQLNQLKEASECVKEAIRQDPTSPHGYTLTGHVFIRRGLTRRAKESFESAIQLDAKNAQAFHGLGMTLLQMDEIDEGINKLEKAVELDPKNLPIRMDLSMSYIRSNRFSDALSQLKSAEQSFPKNQWIKNVISRLRKNVLS